MILALSSQHPEALFKQTIMAPACHNARVELAMSSQKHTQLMSYTVSVETSFATNNV
jgi:hypothetical protein